MIDLRPSRVPLFHSAHVVGSGADAALPRRRLGRLFIVSLALHFIAGGALTVISILSIDQVPPPPIVITFFTTVPPPPPLAPLREESPPPPPPEPEETAAPLPPIEVMRPIERERRRPDPMPEVEPDTPIEIAEIDPEVRFHDVPPAPRHGTPELEKVGADEPLLGGTGAAPELAFLVPGRERRGTGGDLAGEGDGLPPMPGGDPSGSIRRHGDGEPIGGSNGALLGNEGAFTATGLARFLSRKYGVTLMAASRLGRRTHEGMRYAFLIPMLSDTYRTITYRGMRRGAANDPVASIQVDDDAIAIRYRDGTVHVIAPTDDGLVALYVSTDPDDPIDRSKVEEAERALRALQRFTG